MLKIISNDQIPSKVYFFYCTDGNKVSYVCVHVHVS